MAQESEGGILRVVSPKQAALLYIVAQTELYRGEPRLSYGELRRFFTQSVPVNFPPSALATQVPFGMLRKGMFGKDPATGRDVPDRNTSIRDMYKSMIWRMIDDVFGDYEQLHGRGLVYVRDTREEEIKTIAPTHNMMDLMPPEYILITDSAGENYDEILRLLK